MRKGFQKMPTWRLQEELISLWGLSFLVILKLSFLYLTVAKTAMGKPLSTASEGGDLDILGEWEDVTQSEVQPMSGKHVLIGLKVRLEAIPTGLPMSVY